MKGAIARPELHSPLKRGPGNPNLGRETREQREARTRAFREQNLLLKEERLHVERSILEEMEIGKVRMELPAGTNTVDRFLDNLFRNSYWS